MKAEWFRVSSVWLLLCSCTFERSLITLIDNRSNKHSGSLATFGMYVYEIPAASQYTPVCKDMIMYYLQCKVGKLVFDTIRTSMRASKAFTSCLL